MVFFRDWVVADMGRMLVTGYKLSVMSKVWRANVDDEPFNNRLYTWNFAKRVDFKCSHPPTHTDVNLTMRGDEYVN